jgi:hypothetical protein
LVGVYQCTTSPPNSGFTMNWSIGLITILEDDMAVTDVAEPFQMSLAAISKHLTILAGGGADQPGKARAGEVVQAGT